MFLLRFRSTLLTQNDFVKQEHKGTPPDKSQLLLCSWSEGPYLQIVGHIQYWAESVKPDE